MDFSVTTDIALLRRYQRLDRNTSAQSFGDELQRLSLLREIAEEIRRRGLSLTTASALSATETPKMPRAPGDPAPAQPGAWRGPGRPDSARVTR